MGTPDMRMLIRRGLGNPDTAWIRIFPNRAQLEMDSPE